MVRGDCGGLDEELVAALSSRSRLLLHSLEQDCSSKVSLLLFPFLKTRAGSPLGQRLCVRTGNVKVLPGLDATSIRTDAVPGSMIRRVRLIKGSVIGVSERTAWERWF